MTPPSSRGSLVYRFDWTRGAQFFRSFDPAELFSSFGFDGIEGEKGVEARARMLEQTASVASFYRVGPDVLVMSAPPQVQIFGRCPGTAP